MTTNDFPAGPYRPSAAARGYAMIMLMLVVSVIALGLLVAVPVWETQLRREKEEELIFRGNQYIEAIRLYQLKKPGRFPATFEELQEGKFIRKLFRDPMSPTGEWNVVLFMSGVASMGGRSFGGATSPGGGTGESPGRSGPGFQRGLSRSPGQRQSIQRVLVAPESALLSIQNPMILGVVSSSMRPSLRIYNEQASYDKWLFFYGQDPKNPPEIVYWGEDEDERP